MGLLEANIHEERDLPYVLMVSMMHSAIRVNVDTFGENLAFQLLIPYMRNNAKFCVEHFEDWLGLKVDGLEGLIAHMNWTSFMSNRAPMRWRSTGDGDIELEVRGCRTGGQYQNMCEWWCDREHVMMCEESQPDLYLRQTHRLSKGDRQCIWLIRGKNKDLSYNGLATEFQDIPPPDTPVETLDHWAVAGPAEFMTNATTALMDNFDPDSGLTLLCARAKENGRDLAAYYLHTNPRKDSDLELPLLEWIDSLVQIKGDARIDDEGWIVKTITSCPFSGCIPEVCKQIEALRIGALDVISPGSKFSFEEGRGSSSCYWRLKIGIDNTALSELEEKKKMLSTLKWRLVKGEITNEEYEGLKKTIS